MSYEKLLNLNIEFRGDRDYLHGTDIYNAIHSSFLETLQVAHLENIRFKIPHFFMSSIDLIISESPQVSKAEWLCQASGLNLQGKIAENPSAAKPQRRPFDESKLTELMSLTGQGAFLKLPNEASPIEGIVFLAKYLHYQLFPVDAESQWIFTRLELNSSLNRDDSKDVCVEFESALNGFYTKSAITVSGVRRGFIFFSKVNKNTKKAEVALI